MLTRLRLCGSDSKRLVVALLACALVVAHVSNVASACGGFFSRVTTLTTRRPSLAYERSLVIFDEASRREHFVREIVFRAAREPFGFVVPTPGRPEVAGLVSPFDALERAYPYDLFLGAVGSKGGGVGGPRSRAPAPAVTVLEVKKVGSFTSFVLAANDSKALTEWLIKNGFSTTPESQRWLEHYVRLGFFYVAMRYEPPAGNADAERTSAETVRVSFDTPMPYYPYYEPDPPGGVVPDAPRMLELWLVSSRARVPVAAKTEGEAVSWVRPMASGRSYSTNAQPELKKAFGATFSLLPAGPLMIQRFIDQKRSRLGYGDVLFVPKEPSTPNLTDMAKLYPLLDPSLGPPEKIW